MKPPFHSARSHYSDKLSYVTQQLLMCYSIELISTYQHRNLTLSHSHYLPLHSYFLLSSFPYFLLSLVFSILAQSSMVGL